MRESLPDQPFPLEEEPDIEDDDTHLVEPILFPQAEDETEEISPLDTTQSAPAVIPVFIEKPEPTTAFEEIPASLREVSFSLIEIKNLAETFFIELGSFEYLSRIPSEEVRPFLMSICKSVVSTPVDTLPGIFQAAPLRARNEIRCFQDRQRIECIFAIRQRFANNYDSEPTLEELTRNLYTLIGSLQEEIWNYP